MLLKLICLVLCISAEFEFIFADINSNCSDKQVPYDNDLTTERRNAEASVCTTGIIIASIFGILFVIVLIVAVVIFYFYRAFRRESEQLNELEIEKFKQGNQELISREGSANTQNSEYDESLEMNVEDLDIDYQCVLGSGQFANLYKGTAYPKTQSLPVAVKTLKSGATGDNLRAMMAELKVMVYLKTHSNVVRLIGACTNNLIERQLFIVLEFCINGDLQSHLRKNSELFFNFVTNRKISARATAEAKYEGVERMTTLNLIKWSAEIANGMVHISNLNVIHGDIAARNILLDQNLVAKISDFELSERLYEDSVFVRTRTVPLPWRWLAIESLACNEYSSASDVWSYGVTLWEIFSLGTLPYPGLEYNRNFIQMLKDGFRLTLPEFSTDEINDMMSQCWKNDPSDRPKFDQLKTQLEGMLRNYTT